MSRNLSNASQAADQQSTDPPSTFAHTTSLELPEFWMKEPELWFKVAEAAFRQAGVTSSAAQYDHVLAFLPQDVMAAVRGLVLIEITASTPDPYERLKSRLIASYAPSQWVLVNRLIDLPPLGDSRPSELMIRMLALLPLDEPPCVLFRALFLRRLPVGIREHLMVRNFDDPQEMAQHADLIWDSSGPAWCGRK